MSGWMFAKGTGAQSCLTQAAAAGVRSLPLAGAGFAPAQRLFISEADGSEIQWLGRVTQAGSSTISFSRPLELAKSAGARLWSAAATLELSTESLLLERKTVETGILTERSAGGQYYALKLTAPKTVLRLALAAEDSSLEEALMGWLEEQTGWGLDPFTLVNPENGICIVRLSGEPISQEQSASGKRRLVFSLAIAQEGAYQ